MLSGRSAFYHCVLVAAAGVVGTATAGQQYEALQRDLKLSDAQVALLQRGESRDVVGLSNRQQTRLEELRKVADQSNALRDAAALSISAGFIARELWPGGTLCEAYPAAAYAYANKLGLSESQMRQLDQLRQAARATGVTPAHETALALLDGRQKGAVAAFEALLVVVREAIELRLIAAPPKGEVLCN